MHRKVGIVLTLCAMAVMTARATAQMEVSWGGGDGQWTDENWTDGAGLDFIEAFVGIMNGSDGSGGPNAEDIITIGSGTVEYPADALQDDFAMKQGSQLVITGGATWVQSQDDTWSENRWTEMDLSQLILDNGTFRREGTVQDEGGGALIFGSWRGDDNQDTWLPNQETSIQLKNGGRLQNEGGLWFSSPDDVLPDSVFTMTINNGTVDLTGGFEPDSDLFPGVEADLFFFDSASGPTFAVNFTGPGSITVDSTGIMFVDLDLAEATPTTYEDLWDLGILQANGQSGPDGAAFGNFFTVTGSLGSDDYTLQWSQGLDPQLQAGDADQDLDFDQFDLIMVQQAAKYLTGQAATWGDGDWNGAPGGAVGDPPAGDGLFNQLDIIKALGNGLYMTGPYAAVNPGGDRGDEQTSIVYDPATGELGVNAPASTELTSINIDSAAGIFTGNPAENLGGSFDNDADNNVFKATFGGSFGSLSFGTVAQAGLSEEFMLNDLTAVGSLAGGGDLGDVDLIYVPEPASALLLAVGLVMGLLQLRRRSG